MSTTQQSWKETLTELSQLGKQRHENYQQLQRKLHKPSLAKLFMSLDEHIEHDQQALDDYEKRERLAEEKAEALSQQLRQHE